MAIIKHDWHGLYKESWGKTIVPEAYSHPAKFRPALIRQIYAHLLEQGYIEAGDIVLDPFGGVALGALHAMQNGLTWLGVELEARFVNLGQQNIDLWNRKYSTMPGWGQAVILQGDSRHLCEVLGRAGMAGAVSSPPYAHDTEPHGDLRPTGTRFEKLRGYGIGKTVGQLASLPEGDTPQISQVPQAGAVVSSMPYAQIRPEKNSTGVDLAKQYQTYRAQGGGASYEKFCATQRLHSQGYGTTPGNLGNLPAGEPPCAVVASPPYAGGCQHTGGDDPHPEYVQGGTYYGVSLAGAISSPPYTASLASDDPDKRGGLFRDPKRRKDRNMTAEYGASDGQIGAMREGEPPGAMVSSPPYVCSLPDVGGIDWEKAKTEGGSARHQARGRSMGENYGTTAGQLGTMAEGQPIKAYDQLEVLQCQSVRTVESQSQDVVGDVSHVLESTLAHCSRDARSPKDSGQKSLPLNTTRQLQSAGESHIHTGMEGMNGGEDLHGVSSAALPLNGMVTSAPGVDQQTASRFTTNETSQKRAEHGTMKLTTLKRSASPVTLTNTAQPSTIQSALYVEELTEESPQEPAVQLNAEKNHVVGLYKNISQPGQSSTFWEASAEIMRQVYQVLAPGAVAVWVCKAFVRKGALVNFPGQWQTLGESCGFETLEIIRCSLVDDRGAQHTLDGGLKQRQVSHKSFFRRNNEKKGAPRIDYEVVLIQRKVGVE